MGKFCNHAKKAHLVGYDGDKIYVLVSEQGRLIRSHDVVFNEKRPRIEELSDSESENELQRQSKRSKTSSVVDAGEQLNESTSTEVSNETVPEYLPAPSLSPSTHRLGSTMNSVERALIDPPELRLPRQDSPDPIALYAFLVQANEPEPYEPKTYQEALNDSYHKMDWELAMKEEYKSLVTNQTWSLTTPPPGRKILRGKWVYKLKRGPTGKVMRYKARWVVRGFEQREGIDYNETFASVVKPMSYKALFALAAALDWEIEQMDVKTAFLYGFVEEDIYVEQPNGFATKPDLVCRLNKALYGLKQSPRLWFNTLSDFLKTLSFEPLTADCSVLVNHKDSIIIAAYVDDLLIAGPNKSTIDKIKAALNERFQMSDLGACAYYLGMSVRRDRANRILRLGQFGYVEKVLRDFNMWESNPNATPMDGTTHLKKSEEDYIAPAELRTQYQSAVGSLMYAMLGTRPDLAYAVSVVSRYGSNPDNSHWHAVKRIFRYLKGTVNLELVFRGGLKPLTGYSDSDWAGDHDTRRSSAGYVFNIGSGAISWSSKRQATVALSSCEAEYIGQTQGFKEAIWLKALLKQLDLSDTYDALKAVVIYCDNQRAIALAKNPEFHGRSKHIDLRQHWIREKVAAGDIEMSYIATDKQVADGLTKPLPKDKSYAFRKALGLEPSP